MKVVVFGATGETGRLLTAGALRGGHAVTAFVRDPARMPIVHERLRTVRGDVLDPPSVDQAIPGHDVVLSALGSTARNPEPVLSDGVRHILDAMERHHVRRIVALSAAGALGESAGYAIGNAGLWVFRRWLPEVYEEHRKMLEDLRRRNLEWIAVRAVLLTNGAAKGRYRVALEGIPRWGFRISRADIADFMIRQLTTDEFVRKMPATAY